MAKIMNKGPRKILLRFGDGPIRSFHGSTFLLLMPILIKLLELSCKDKTDSTRLKQLKQQLPFLLRDCPGLRLSFRGQHNIFLSIV